MTIKRKWVSVWGNAVSVAENRPERYAKDITIRYPINIPFAGEALRLTFDNYCGTEAITLSKITVFYGGEFYPVLVNGERSATIPAREKVVTDPLELKLNEGELIQVSFYLADFTLMRSVVFSCGPLSEGLYANGDQTENAAIDIVTSRRTQLFYFLSNVSILTDGGNRTIVCYGDSITAQDWPDFLAMRCFREGIIRPPSSAGPPAAPASCGSTTASLTSPTACRGRTALPTRCPPMERTPSSFSRASTISFTPWGSRSTSFAP